VCEVLSPSTERIDRGKKLRIYAEAAVAHAWLVNPIEHTLEVLRLRDGAWTIVAVCGGGDRVRAEPFDAIELALGTLWIDAESATSQGWARVLLWKPPSRAPTRDFPGRLRRVSARAAF
jgi:hypothetical protein